MKSLHVSTTVNGDPVEFICDPGEPLLDVLRNRLGLTGAKEGCGTGDCGEISTIEGMADDDQLHPLQRAFIDGAAFQCGVCTPGILVAAKALLEKNPEPTDEEVRFWLAGNLCRCTGYDKIIAAVQVAAAEMRGA